MIVFSSHRTTEMLDKSSFLSAIAHIGGCRSSRSGFLATLNNEHMSSSRLLFIKEESMTNVEKHHSNPASGGIVLHAPRFYDFLAWLLMRGREGPFREKVIELARLKPGESVLDVGCGTGTLAMAAKRHVGATGNVYGIDASPEMIARAKTKARKAALDIDFKNESIEALAFPDAQFDVVLSTLMLHHLPRKVRERSAREMRRVLKPGGRLLVVDFGGLEQKRGLLAHFHQRHGHVKPTEIITLLSATGLNVIESGVVGIKDMHFALATVPC
jgi:ubiquinone/menaquinone biosynthesis C-methylase UbiE